MHLQSINLSGFRTYASPTCVDFDSQVTGIVGPDGVGKSSMLDALLWCVGYQLDDEILFQGAERRSAAAVAKVSLIWMGENGEDRYQITRSLWRNGRSEVELEGERVDDQNAQAVYEQLGAAFTVIDSLEALEAACGDGSSGVLLMDEIDAGFSDEEYDRFTSLISEASGKHQVILVSQSKKTMSVADLLIGVVMEEWGIATLIGMKLTAE